MSSLAETWGHERLAATVYDAGVQSRVIGRVAGQLLWGVDTRKLFASINQVGEAPAGSRVLDVPCGGGLVFNALRPGHGLEYTALDFSPVMLERARHRMRRLGLSGIDFRQGDVGALPFADGSVDLCLTYNGIHCFPDPERAIHEMARVLRPDGVLRGTLVVRGAGRRFDALIRLFQHRGYFGPTCTRADLERWFAASGLRVCRQEQSGGLFLFEALRVA